MKFLCDQCKAKYQISDDKVVGKTVRMKCRKCGHMIEVRAAVTETSVSASLNSVHPPAPAAGKSPLATSFAQAKPAAPRGTKENSAPHHLPAPSKEDEAALLELASADEWYAAINGAPAGPMRIGELRRRVIEGAVTEDSLVWKEGMEEWRPLRAVPELAQMIRDAALKPAPLPPPPPLPAELPAAARPRTSPREPSTSVRPAAPARPAPPRPAPALQAPRPGQIAARSNVVPFGSRTALAEKLEEVLPEPASFPPPPAVPEPVAAEADPFQAPASAMVEVSLPPVAPAPVAASAQTSLPVVAPPPPRQPNYIAIGMIVGFAAFGVTLALVFRPQPPPAPAPQIIVQQVPVPQVAPAPVAPTAPTAEPVAPSDPVPSAPRAARTAKPGSGAPTDAPKTQDLHDLNSLLGPGMGPGAGPSTGGSGGGQLTASEIEGEVNRHKIAVRRTCFERLGSSAGAANEVVHVSIGGDGHVSSASAEGNNGVVGTCLEKEIRNWAFPPRGSTTKVDLPFHFVLQ